MTDSLQVFIKSIQRRQSITIKRLDNIEKALSEISEPSSCEPQAEEQRGPIGWFLDLIGLSPRRDDSDAA